MNDVMREISGRSARKVACERKEYERREREGEPKSSPKETPDT